MTEQEELRILIRTVAQTQGATQTSAALKETQQTATNLNNTLKVGAEDVVRFGAALTGVTVGLSLFAAAGNALRGALANSIGTGVEFGRQIASVGAVSGATGDELAKLSDLARTAGQDIGVGATEGARGLAELAKGGVTTQQALGGALRATEILAKAGGVDLASAAEISAVALNSFGLSAAELAKVADLVAGAANASSIGVEDFRQSLTQAGAVARTVGVSFDDVSVAIAELGQAGIRGADAGTSLRTFLLSLNPSSKQAADALRQLGIITADGANRFFDATGKAKGLAEISDILRRSLAGYSSQQQIATLQTIFGTDAIRAASVFAREGADGFDRLTQSMANVKAADVARQSIDSLGGDLDILKAKAENAAIQFERLFDPSLRAAAKEFADQLGRLPDGSTSTATPQRRQLFPVPTPGGPVQIPLPNSNPNLRSIPGAAEAVAAQQRADAERRAAAGQQARQTTPFTLSPETTRDLPKLPSELAQADAAATNVGHTFSLVNESLRQTHTTLAQIVQDISDLSARSGQLSALQNALNPRDTQGQATVAVQQALQQIDAQINARKALLAIEQEIRREQEATKITDPRDAAGADQARKRLDTISQLLPAEQALSEAQQRQRDLQSAGTQISGQEAALTLTILPQRQAIADIERQINNLGHDRISLIQEQSRLLAQQAALGPQNALDDTQAQIQRDQLLLKVRGVDPEERRRARAEIRNLTRNVLPGEEVSAFDANRNVTLADRASRAHDIQIQLQQNQLRQVEDVITKSIQSTEAAIRELQNQQQQIQLLGQIAQAVIAARQQAIQVIVQGAVQILGDTSNPQTNGAISDAVGQKIAVDVSNQMREGLGQIQLPPAVQSSAIRRAA